MGWWKRRRAPSLLRRPGRPAQWGREPLIVVVIDEVDALTESPAVRKLVNDLAAKGRRQGRR